MKNSMSLIFISVVIVGLFLVGLSSAYDPILQIPIEEDISIGSANADILADDDDDNSQSNVIYDDSIDWAKVEEGLNIIYMKDITKAIELAVKYIRDPNEIIISYSVYKTVQTKLRDEADRLDQQAADAAFVRKILRQWKQFEGGAE